MSNDAQPQQPDGHAPAGALARLRERWPELVIEMVSILVAVSLAFALDAWSAERDRQQEAAQLRAAVNAEIVRNAADLANSLAAFERTTANLDHYLSAPGKPSSLRVEIDLALSSDAAYRVMQGADAANALDLDWRIGIARLYALQGLVGERQQRAIDALAALTPEDGTLPKHRVQALRAELSTLGQLRARLAQAYAEHATPAPTPTPVAGATPAPSSSAPG